MLTFALFVLVADFGVEVPIFNYLRLYLPERVLEKKLKLLLISIIFIMSDVISDKLFFE